MYITINPALIREMTEQTIPAAVRLIDADGTADTCQSVQISGGPTGSTVHLIYNPTGAAADLPFQSSLSFVTDGTVTITPISASHGHALLDELQARTCMRRAERCCYVHTNLHTIRRDRKHGTVTPAIAVRRSRSDTRPTYCTACTFAVPGPDAALLLLACPGKRAMKCGAKVYLVAPHTVTVQPLAPEQVAATLNDMRHDMDDPTEVYL